MVFYCLLLLVATVGFTACSEDEGEVSYNSQITTKQELVAKPGKTLVAEIEASEWLSNFTVKTAPEGWTVNLDEQAKTLEIVPLESAYGSHEIEITALDPHNEEVLAALPVQIAPMSAKEGVYVLSEGSLAPGKLTYIDGDGDLFDNVYHVKNNEQLGAVSQDLCIRDGKMYILAQDGTLVVADAATLVKIASFQLYLDSPSHLAVFDDETIYVRDMKRVYLYNSVTQSLTEVEDTEYSPKAPMLMIGDNLYLLADRLFKIKKGETRPSLKSEFRCVSGVVKADDGNLIVSSQKDLFGDPDKSYVRKVNAETLEVIEEHIIEAFNWEHGMEASSSLAVKGDMVYYSGTRSVIWRHNFATGETKSVFDASKCEDAYPQGLTYNTVAVHPVTGKLYLNRLSGYQTFTENKILVLEDKGEQLEIVKTYDNYTEFPAGFFFPANFE